MCIIRMHNQKLGHQHYIPVHMPEVPISYALLNYWKTSIMIHHAGCRWERQPKKTKGLNTFMSRKFVFALAMASELGFPASPSLDFLATERSTPIRRKGSKGRGDSVRGLSCTGNLGYQTETYSLHPPSTSSKQSREEPS